MQEQLQHSENEVERLKNVVNEKDSKIMTYKEELITTENNGEEIRAGLRLEIGERNEQIFTLRGELKNLQDKLRQADMQTRFKDDIIKELRKEVKVANNKLQFLGLNYNPVSCTAASKPHTSHLENNAKDVVRTSKIGHSCPVYKHEAEDDILIKKSAAGDTGNNNISRGTSPHRCIKLKQPIGNTYDVVLNSDFRNGESNENKNVSLKMTLSTNEHFKIAQRRKCNKHKVSDYKPEKNGLTIKDTCGNC